jgi:hypothetical protein
MIGAAAFHADADAHETTMTVADASRKPKSRRESAAGDSLRKLVLASDDETRCRWA